MKLNWLIYKHSSIQIQHPLNHGTHLFIGEIANRNPTATVRRHDVLVKI